MSDTDTLENNPVSSETSAAPRKPWSAPRFRELAIGTATQSGANPFLETETSVGSRS